MRKRLAFISFFALSIPATAQTDTVTVQQDPGLPGLWKIAVPESFSIGLGFGGGHTSFGTMKNAFCRITEKQEIHCLNRDFKRNGTASQDGTNVHIAWGTMMLRVVIDGTRLGDTITGTFSFKLAGIRHDDPAPSVSTRLAMPQDNAPNQSPYLFELLTQLSANALTTAYDAKAITKNDGALPTDVGKLGGAEAIAYLGTSPRSDGAQEADFYRAYLVEFAKGERLCGVHQRDDGVLDDFRCV